MKAGGCTDAEAEATGTHLIGANLAGHDSHGIVRVPRYHAWLRDGTLNGNTPLAVILDTGALIQCDGQHGIGQFLAAEATALGISRARDQGVAIVTLRRAGHIGRLGHYAETAAAAGLASIQFCNVNGSLLVAPFGAAERHMSTNPVAVGVPNSDHDPFILDFATSFVAEGKALVAASGGKPLPDAALVSKDGVLTGDPAALYGETIATGMPDAKGGSGALRTMGEHKGSGLALACDLIAGALTGNGTNVSGGPFGNGWVAIFVDPGRLDDKGLFASEVAEYINAARALKPAEGIDRVRIPGDVERETRAERQKNGAPISQPLLQSLLDTAHDAGVQVSPDDLLMPRGLPA